MASTMSLIVALRTWAVAFTLNQRQGGGGVNLRLRDFW